MYIFKTKTTMKDYNSNKYWIMGNIVGDIRVDAESMEKAVEEWRQIVSDNYFIDVSNNAIKNKSPMYIDDKNGNSVQIGYVFTGKTEFEDEARKRWTAQFVDLWVEILQVSAPEF